jgi:hypothetical protein
LGSFGCLSWVVNLKQLAAALGISGSMTSRLVKRGMPVDLERAQRWRARHLELARTKFMRADAPAPARASAAPATAPAARVDASQAALSNAPAATDGADAALRATEMGKLALHALQAGKFELAEEPMRQALRDVPSSHRAEVVLAIDLWNALTADVFDECVPDAERASATPMTDEDVAVVGRFWYYVAAGEVGLCDPAATPGDGALR